MDRSRGMASVPLAILFLTSSVSAFGSIIFDAGIPTAGAGFGSLPRHLTIHHGGRAGSPSACLAVSGSGATTGGSGSCIDDSLVYLGNGLSNTGGAEASPLPMFPAISNQKHGTPTLGSLGITSALDIGLMFDGVQPGSRRGIEILDITMKFYRADTFAFIGAIDGQHNLSSIESGVGNAGFGFRLDEIQAAIVQGWIAANRGPNYVRFALESTLAKASGGPDSWLVFSLGTAPIIIPEPASLVMLGAGLMAIGLLRTRSRKT